MTLQLGTRTFSQPTADGHASIHYALPLLDLAKHENTCPHYNAFQPCAFDEARECAYFTAGADVKSGDELCSWYGYLLPDRAFLEYGLLPEVPAAAAAAGVSKAKKVKKTAAAATAADKEATKASAAATAPAQPKLKKKAVKKSKAAEAQLPALPLFGIDRHDFNPANPLAKLDTEPRPFWGESLPAVVLRSTADAHCCLHRQSVLEVLRPRETCCAPCRNTCACLSSEDHGMPHLVLSCCLVYVHTQGTRPA